MKFPNAARGVKKIFTAEILKLFAAVALIAMLIAAAVALVSDAGDQTGLALGSSLVTIILLFAASVLLVVGYIINLVGLIQSSKDESAFKSALVCVILSIACSATASAFSGLAVISGIASSLEQFFDLAITIFVIQGIIRLADRLNRGDVSAKGSSLFKQMLVIYLLIIVANIVATVFGGVTASLTAAILLIAAGVLKLIQYVMYLNFLSNAKKMLKES